METIKGGNPDRFVNQYEAFNMLLGSPFGEHNPNPKRGELNVVNAWGVKKSWPAELPGAFPVHDEASIATALSSAITHSTFLSLLIIFPPK